MLDLSKWSESINSLNLLSQDYSQSNIWVFLLERAFKPGVECALPGLRETYPLEIFSFTLDGHHDIFHFIRLVGEEELLFTDLADFGEVRDQLRSFLSLTLGVKVTGWADPILVVISVIIKLHTLGHALELLLNLLWTLSLR